MFEDPMYTVISLSSDWSALDFFAHSRDQRAVTCLQNVRQLDYIPFIKKNVNFN